MKIGKWWLLGVLLPLTLSAGNPSPIRSLSERQVVATYTDIMRDGCKFADRYWHGWNVDSRAGMWGSGRSDNMNEGIRAISEMVLTSSALLKYSDNLTQTERDEYLRKSIAALRYSVASHVSGTNVCTDGKPWGNSWQSAMWTGELGFGSWLIWDRLDAGLRIDIERVVAFEADRFLKDKPPAGTTNDTKAEENGWNLTCLAVAATMFPNHSHAAAWNQKAIEYMINTLSAPQDQQDKTIVDGKSVSDWFSGPNIHEDFTLENHGFFHPAYVGCSSYFLTQTAMYYTYAHRPVPDAAKHHLMDVWQMFQTIILPWGASAYPQGMDWELHGIPYFNLYASMATLHQDRFAARMEMISPQYYRSWQVMSGGDLAVPGSKLGFTRHAIIAEQATWAFLAHKIFGSPAKPLSERQAAELTKGVHLHDSIRVATHRTDHKLFSVSWGSRPMAMIVPIGSGHETNPNFTVPIMNEWLGSFDLTPRGDAKTGVTEYSWHEITNGFETTATLLLNGGRLKQIITITSVGEHTVVYQDRVTALTNVTVDIERGLPIAIENDKITGGTRTVTSAAGKSVFDWQAVQKPRALSGSWANVDGRLGVVSVSGSGLNYSQATGYQQGMAVYPDILYASFSNTGKTFKAGDEIAHRVAILYAEVTEAKTAKLAQDCKIESTPTGSVLSLRLPEGKAAKVALQ